MKRTIEYDYWETEIPPRCRKPRLVEHSAKMTVTIPEVTETQAPIAIIQHTYPYQDKSVVNDLNFRWFRKHLYVPCPHHKIISRGENRQVTFDEIHNPDLWGRYSQRETRKALLTWAREWFILDGLVWHRTGEPRYVVMTFGLGYNHGLGWGTSLSESTFYNSNISKQRYFRIDEEEAAVAEATRIAEGRGDTKALPISKQGYAHYDIFLPEAVRCKPSKEHSDGDPFINSIEKIIDSSSDSTTAGILAMAFTARQI